MGDLDQPAHSLNGGEPMTGLDNHITGGRYHEYNAEMECADGHSWTVRMFSEYGGSFFVDEDAGPYCPECKMEGEVR